MRINVGISGGGTHLFQQLGDPLPSPPTRIRGVHALLAYLAKQNTLFGERVHIGCDNGDEALLLCHRLAPYAPQFIALSASSPYQQGIDSHYESSRLHALGGLPLSGAMPPLRTWRAFEAHCQRLRDLGVAQHMQDFYWDIRPNPEYGTVEIGVLDTPLTLRRAVDLGIYCLALARHVTSIGARVDDDAQLVYAYNRFVACRFGYDAQIIDIHSGELITLADDIRRTLTHLLRHAEHPTREALLRLQEAALLKRGDAGWMRERIRPGRPLSDVVRQQTELWALH